MSAFGEVLFHRSAQSDENSDRNDIWDDEILIKSYDKALKIAQEQVAKRIAQSTNNLGPPKENDKSEPSTSKKSKHKNKNTWQTKNSGKIGKFEVGAYCRAPYSEDQKDYEATILRKIDKDRCLVRFIGKCFTLSQLVSPSRSIIIEIRHKDVRPSFKQLQLKCVEQLYEHTFSEGICQLLDFSCGHINLSFYLSYDNEEEVLLSELKPSSGDDARVEQIKVATMLDIKLDIEHNAEDMESLEPMEQSVEESVEKPAIRKMTRHFKKRNHMANMPNPFQFGLTGMPSMPPYPSLPMGDLPPLPPPMPFPLAGLTGTDDDTQEQQQAMSSMLLSWYMSGYYTGIYQGTMKANSSKCKNCHKRKT